MNDYATRIAADAVRLERLLPGPIERVWEFLTDSGKRARWLAGGEMQLAAGGKVTLDFDHASLSAEPTPAKYRDMQMEFTGKVLRCEPPTLLEFTWLESHGGHSQVLWELAPRGEQVLFTITHRRIPDREELLDIAAGWDVHAGILEDVLDARTPRLFWSTHEQLAAEYGRRFTA
jgi:uncharacterized protein YndB with AHSA1/START domain